MKYMKNMQIRIPMDIMVKLLYKLKIAPTSAHADYVQTSVQFINTSSLALSHKKKAGLKKIIIFLPGVASDQWFWWCCSQVRFTFYVFKHFPCCKFKNKLKVARVKCAFRHTISSAAYLFSLRSLSALLGHNVYLRLIILLCKEKDWLWLIVPGHA